MTSSEADPLHVKGAVRKVKKRLRSVRARLSSGSHKSIPTDETSSVHRQGPLAPVLQRIARTASVPISIYHPPRSRTTSTTSHYFSAHPDISSKDMDLLVDGSDAPSMAESSSLFSHETGPSVPISHETGRSIVSLSHPADELLGLQGVHETGDQRVEPEYESSHDAMAPLSAVDGPSEVADGLSPAPVAESDVPDPFLVDDPDDPLSDPESLSTPLALDAAELSKSQTTITPTEEVLLGAPTPASPSKAIESPIPGLSKPVVAVPTPPPMTYSSGSDAPAIYLPQLVLPNMFLPIPNVRLCFHLTWWLTRCSTF